MPSKRPRRRCASRGEARAAAADIRVRAVRVNGAGAGAGAIPGNAASACLWVAPLHIERGLLSCSNRQSCRSPRNHFAGMESISHKMQTFAIQNSIF
ncbi:hypothetical protein EMIT0111MI5_10617 [Burkholderia sp. IT-111MI5]